MSEDETVTNCNALKPERSRTFLEIVVRYPGICTYPEYEGKPYYGIKYAENGETIVGFGTYKIEVLSQYLRDYFPNLRSSETDLRSCREKCPDTDAKCCQVNAKSDLISRNGIEKAIRKICDVCGEDKKYNGVMCGSCNLDNFIRIMDDIPSAEPEQKKGEWEVQLSTGDDRPFIWWKCSVCGHVIFSETERDRKEFHAFCGRCGADMRGDDE